MKELITKYSNQFKVTDTVRTIAETIIIEQPQLTHNQTADLVQCIRNEHGMQCNTSGSCIAWYKQKMKNTKDTLQQKIQFRDELNKLPAKDKNKILANLGTKYLDQLIKLAKAEDLKIPTKA